MNRKFFVVPAEGKKIRKNSDECPNCRGDGFEPVVDNTGKKTIRVCRNCHGAVIRRILGE